MKNIIWWEIAATSYRSGRVAYSYTLTSDRAQPIAEKYGVSVYDLFDFFRQGVDADWKTPEEPPSRD